MKGSPRVKPDPSSRSWRRCEKPERVEAGCHTVDTDQAACNSKQSGRPVVCTLYLVVHESHHKYLLSKWQIQTDCILVTTQLDTAYWSPVIWERQEASEAIGKEVLLEPENTLYTSTWRNTTYHCFSAHCLQRSTTWLLEQIINTLTVYEWMNEGCIHSYMMCKMYIGSKKHGNNLWESEFRGTLLRRNVKYRKMSFTMLRLCPAIQHYNNHWHKASEGW